MVNPCQSNLKMRERPTGNVRNDGLTSIFHMWKKVWRGKIEGEDSVENSGGGVVSRLFSMCGEVGRGEVWEMVYCFENVVDSFLLAYVLYLLEAYGKSDPNIVRRLMSRFRELYGEVKLPPMGEVLENVDIVITLLELLISRCEKNGEDGSDSKCLS